jgi:hypothetical protein
MRYQASLMIAGLALAGAAAVFEIKGTVREVERELQRTERAIDDAHWRLQTLKADYAYLTRPERLAVQAEQLGMVPGTSARLVAVHAIAKDTQLAFAAKVVPVVLNTGEQVELRFKPAVLGMVAEALAR